MQFSDYIAACIQFSFALPTLDFVLYILGLKEGYQNWALQAISPIVEAVMANGIEEDL